MDEFLRQNYSILTKTVEIVAAVTGLLMLKKYKHSTVKYFIYFLGYVAIIELIAAYPRYFANYDFLSEYKAAFRGTLFEKNYWWYNIFWTIGSALFYAFYFTKIIKTKRFKTVIKYCTAIFLVSVITNSILNFDLFFISSMPFNKTVAAAIILLCTTLYFTEILQSEKILTFYKSINFFISATIFIWFLILTPVVYYNIYFSTADWNFIVLKWQLFLSMNIFMYLTFTFALIWCKPQND